jgi:IS30 family transposase
VERTTGYTMLVHLPDGSKAEQVRDALTAKIKTIPEILRASLTWDQGFANHSLPKAMPSHGAPDRLLERRQPLYRR